MPFEALYIFGILIIGGGMAYAVMRSRNRNKANDPITEEAVRQQYDDPEGYAKGGEQRLRQQAKPKN